MSFSDIKDASEIIYKKLFFKSTGEYLDNTKIENFGQVNEFLFRGAEPKNQNDYNVLSQGVRTVLDLRDNAKPKARTNGC